jgi:hypothetical protein
MTQTGREIPHGKWDCGLRRVCADLCALLQQSTRPPSVDGRVCGSAGPRKRTQSETADHFFLDAAPHPPAPHPPRRSLTRTHPCARAEP